MSQAYKDAGVNIEAGYEAVEKMKKHVQRTVRKEVMNGLGGFGGAFDLTATGVREPVLISGTDGVGTKLKLAFQMDRHDTIGIDCVAMCVNDVLTQGALPLFFLDYIAIGKAEPNKVEAIVAGVSEGCVQAGCALIGGETAEMSDMYGEGEYDIAGFTVGVVEKSEIITGNDVNEGDVLIGLSSSGIHSNGYSLVRKIVRDHQLDLQQTYGDMEKSLGEELLTPTRIYVNAIKGLRERVQIKAMAHVTGGGFYENLPRALPEGLGVTIERGTWPIPKIFTFLQEKANIETKEMMNVFNMGIGFGVWVAPHEVDTALQTLADMGEEAYVIGRVTRGEGVTVLGGNGE